MSRGLESLIPKKGPSGGSSPLKKEDVFWIEVEKIVQNPYQPRSFFNENELDKLASSIKKHGILQPLIVTKIEKSNGNGIKIEYELIAGERRLKACKKIGIDRVPVIIRNSNSQEKLELALIENIQRANLNPVERAEAYMRLRQEFGLLEKEIAEVVGKSREGISNTLRILTLPTIIKEALKKEMISEGHAKVLMSLKNPEDQKKFLKMIIEEGLSVRRLEQEIKSYLKPKTPSTIKDKALIEEIEGRFKKIFHFDGIKVKNKKDAYQVLLDFKSKDEMEDFMKKM